MDKCTLFLYIMHYYIVVFLFAVCIGLQCFPHKASCLARAKMPMLWDLSAFLPWIWRDISCVHLCGICYNRIIGYISQFNNVMGKLNLWCSYKLCT